MSKYKQYLSIEEMLKVVDLEKQIHENKIKTVELRTQRDKIITKATKRRYKHEKKIVS